MNLGFDLDKIFIDYPPFIPDTLIDRLYKLKSNGILLYRIPSKPEQLLRIISHHYFFRPPITRNIEFIKNLTSGNKNKYYLISSRFGFLKKRTEIIIKKYQFDKIFDAMLFNYKNQQPHIFKDQEIKKMKIDLYVDDDLPLLKFIAKNNPNTKFFWLNKKHTKPLDKNLFAIIDLPEMLK